MSAANRTRASASAWIGVPLAIHSSRPAFVVHVTRSLSCVRLTRKAASNGHASSRSSGIHHQPICCDESQP